MADGIGDDFLGIFVAGGGVDDVDAFIEQEIEDSRGLLALGL